VVHCNPKPGSVKLCFVVIDPSDLLRSYHSIPDHELLLEVMALSAESDDKDNGFVPLVIFDVFL
jgi:hypothetical protein